MTKNDIVKILLNTLIGFLTVILSYILPIAGGGVSLIFVLTVPANIGISLISSIAYFILAKKQKTLSKNTVLITSIALNLLITFLFFPYK